MLKNHPWPRKTDHWRRAYLQGVVEGLLLGVVAGGALGTLGWWLL